MRYRIVAAAYRPRENPPIGGNVLVTRLRNGPWKLCSWQRPGNTFPARLAALMLDKIGGWNRRIRALRTIKGLSRIS